MNRRMEGLRRRVRRITARISEDSADERRRRIARMSPDEKRAALRAMLPHFAQDHPVREYAEHVLRVGAFPSAEEQKQLAVESKKARLAVDAQRGQHGRRAPTD